MFATARAESRLCRIQPTDYTTLGRWGRILATQTFTGKFAVIAAGFEDTAGKWAYTGCFPGLAAGQ
jgi:hypothetical protein